MKLNTHKIYCRKVRINIQGYDNTGRYWGVGNPLYHVQVLAKVTCPIELPDVGMVEPMMYEPGGQEYWRTKTTIVKWNEPFYEYYRACDRYEAIMMARFDIIGSMKALYGTNAKLVDKRHRINYRHEV